MRILLATYWPFPHVGGVSTYLDTLRNGLERMGHEVEILAQHPDLTGFYLVKREKKMEKNCFQTQMDASVFTGYEQLGIDLTPWILQREVEKYTFESVCRKMELDSYDLVHTQDILSTFSCARVKPLATPLVATIHGCLATEWIANDEIQARTPIEQEYLALEEHYGAMSPDHLILPSHWLSDRLSTFQVSHSKQHIIPYGLDTQIFQERLCQEGQPPRETCRKIIACPARLVAIKGQSYLLEAMHLLIQKRKDVACWLIGDGVMRGDLEQQVQRLGLQNHVRFLGDRSDVPALISLADVVVLPSLQDNLPFAVIEAQTVGKPVVASKVGGIVEMIEDGKNGCLVDPKDVYQLSERLLLLLDNDSLRERQSQEAKKRAATEWTAAIMLERTLYVYREAMNDRVAPKISPFDSCSAVEVPDRSFAAKLKTNSAPATAFPPPVVSLHGKIAAGNANSGTGDAFVHLIDVSGVVLRSTKTNQSGAYTIDDVQPGNYALTCVVPGFGTCTRKIFVFESDSLRVDFEI